MQRIERGSEVPQRRHEVAPTSLQLELRDQSDWSKSLAFSVSGARESLSERRLTATTATSRSDHVRSLAFSVDQSDVSQRPREVARVFCDWSDVSQQPREVAPEPVQVSTSSILSGLIRVNQP
ncbi:hypothetical protein F2Q70_00005874 [Brassica cretica]|uniref:Uncharacterized protein n=1 Tax=Brassica cretica TaxID=69181 RepID=A0A8S9IXY7_BRACR|nr:hypothetical protein F2Q70_00005874 [Brassica cretica]